jgi:deoxycytidylate deaminase
LDEKIAKTVEDMRARLNIPKEPTGMLARIFDVINESTDWVCPVAAVCRYNGRYYSGTNKSDFNLPMYDIVNRTELYYAATEHAEVNLLKKMGEVENLDSPLYISLFPCDKCMKILIQKGVKKIYYLEDHEERHWSQRSHALADANGIKTIKINPADYDAKNKS